MSKTMTTTATRHETRRRRARRKRRGGYLYVAVLFTSLIVAGSIATALSLDTARIKTLNASADRGSAIRLAESEIHRISVLLSTDSDWRDEVTNATPSDWVTYGSLMGADNAAARFVLVDQDGDLADDVFDDTELIAHARFGQAEAAVSVVMENGYAPLDLLRFGVSTFDDLRCEGGATLVSEKPVQVFDDCKTDSSGWVVTPVLEFGSSLELYVTGDLATSDVQSPTFDVVARYEDTGTEIEFDSLPIINGSRSIQSVVVSPSANPYGAVDEDGIYWIDAEGQQLRISNSRLNAVIAVRNASRILVTGAMNWQHPGETGVILVTNAPVDFDAIEPTLDETSLAANFNPPSSPYRGKESNLTLSDQFPTELRGIVYSSNNIRVGPTSDGQPLAITGSVLCNDLRLYHSLQVRALDEVLTEVPIGFADPSQYRFRSGTFRRVTAPQP